MKVLVVWASRTGNTEKIGKAIARAFPDARSCSVEDAPESADFDLAFVGAWLDKGGLAVEARDYIQDLDRIAKKQSRRPAVALFGTMGGSPESQRACDVLKKYYEEWKSAFPNLRWIGWRFWRGRVDPELVKAMSASMPMTEERAARIKAAEGHPDHEDCDQASEWGAFMLSKAKEE